MKGTKELSKGAITARLKRSTRISEEELDEPAIELDAVIAKVRLVIERTSGSSESLCIEA